MYMVERLPWRLDQLEVNKREIKIVVFADFIRGSVRRPDLAFKPYRVGRLRHGRPALRQALLAFVWTGHECPFKGTVVAHRAADRDKCATISTFSGGTVAAISGNHSGQAVPAARRST